MNKVIRSQTTTMRQRLSALARSLVAIIGLAGAALAGTSIAATSTAQAGSLQPAKTVLELFTSQGCSSCPPADELLGEFAKRRDTIALTMPVDYWDYLGWRDTFAKRLFTNRQKRYAMMRRDGQVYTPQVVINGRAAEVGSQRGDILKTAAALREDAADGVVKLKLSVSGDAVSVRGSVSNGTPITGATVWLAGVQRAGDVTIRAGENRGRTIRYTYVVRRMERIGTWNGDRFAASMSNRWTQDETGMLFDGLVVLVQASDHGPILGATDVWRDRQGANIGGLGLSATPSRDG